MSISCEEAFELGWHLNGCLRHCQDGRDLARFLTCDWAIKIADLGRDLGLLPIEKAMVIVKQRITERLNEQDGTNGQGNAEAERHG